jgi:hypothetical protein
MRLYGEHFQVSIYAYEDLEIEWVPVGTPFAVREYDSSEWVDTKPLPFVA